MSSGFPVASALPEAQEHISEVLNLGDDDSVRLRCSSAHTSSRNLAPTWALMPSPMTSTQAIGHCHQPPHRPGLQCMLSLRTGTRLVLHA